MRVDIRDQTALRSLVPIEVASYIRSIGWRQVDKLGVRGTVWEKDTGQSRGPEILLPASREVIDFTTRMSEVLSTLSKVEGKSQLALFNELRSVATDVVRFRLHNPGFEDGTVPLHAGKFFVKAAYDMMESAAYAAFQPRAVYQGRRPDVVTDYMQNLRLGQTEVGSYVLTIRSPVPPMLRIPIQADLFGVTQPQAAQPEEPFERRVTLKLASALGALKGAADESGMSGNIDPFTSAIPSGVSADLCESIAELSTRSRAESIEVGLQWSQARPLSLPLGEQVPSRVIIPSDVTPLLRETARVFRENIPRNEFDLFGYVVRLDSTDAAVEGTITVAGAVDGDSRKVHLQLDAEGYHKAIAAHKDGSQVKCIGTLRKTGTSYVLEGPHGFSVDTDDGL